MTNPKNSIIINNAMKEVPDKKSRWSKKQIIGIIADDIENSGKLGKLITQVLKSKKKEVIKA